MFRLERKTVVVAGAGRGVQAIEDPGPSISAQTSPRKKPMTMTSLPHSSSLTEAALAEHTHGPGRVGVSAQGARGLAAPPATPIPGIAVSPAIVPVLSSSEHLQQWRRGLVELKEGEEDVRSVSYFSLLATALYVTSASFLAEILVRLPRKLFIFIIYKNILWI